MTQLITPTQPTVQEERITHEIKLVKSEPFFKSIFRRTTRCRITKLESQAVTEINLYKDKQVIKVRANIPFRYLRKI
jgi:hypothetical protein